MAIIGDVTKMDVLRYQRADRDTGRWNLRDDPEWIKGAFFGEHYGTRDGARDGIDVFLGEQGIEPYRYRHLVDDVTDEGRPYKVRDTYLYGALDDLDRDGYVDTSDPELYSMGFWAAYTRAFYRERSMYRRAMQEVSESEHVDAVLRGLFDGEYIGENYGVTEANKRKSYLTRYMTSNPDDTIYELVDYMMGLYRNTVTDRRTNSLAAESWTSDDPDERASYVSGFHHGLRSMSESSFRSQVLHLIHN